MTSPEQSKKSATSALWMLVILASAYTLHLAREMLLPLTLAVILALLFTPVVSRLERLRIPRPVSSVLLIGGSLVLSAGALWLLSSAAMGWLQRLPEASDILRYQLDDVQQEVQQMGDATASIDALTQTLPAQPAEKNEPRQVVISEPGWRTDLWIGAKNFAVFGALSIILHSDLRRIRSKTSNRRTPFANKTLWLESESHLAGVMGCEQTRINSLHHQAIAELGDGLHVVGRDLDGIVQAVENPQQRFLVGVQWHPEYLPLRQSQQAIFQALVQASARQ